MKALDAVPYYERQWGDWLVRNMINTKLKLGLGVLKNGKSKNWQAELAQELHKPVKRYFTQRRVVNHIDEIWAADLVDMQKFSKWNKGYKHLLMVIDVFNKYAWIKPLKDKTGEIVTEAFKSIFKEGKRLKYLWVNNGKEFYNKHLKDLLDKHSITIYWTENEEKSGVVERWNRTIKQRMWKEFTVQGNTQYFDILPQLLTKYSNTKHSSTEMMSAEAIKRRIRELFIWRCLVIWRQQQNQNSKLVIRWDIKIQEKDNWQRIYSKLDRRDVFHRWNQVY